ncbi:MAG: hypothetical protein HQM09_17380 [Candidatus Riflebacteria bacterium]|nr:hypothetical protein [Candidatus Riflebacteria bacterium]
MTSLGVALNTAMCLDKDMFIFVEIMRVSRNGMRSFRDGFIINGVRFSGLRSATLHDTTFVNEVPPHWGIPDVNRLYFHVFDNGWSDQNLAIFINNGVFTAKDVSTGQFTNFMMGYNSVKPGGGLSANGKCFIYPNEAVAQFGTILPADGKSNAIFYSTIKVFYDDTGAGAYSPEQKYFDIKSSFFLRGTEGI